MSFFKKLLKNNKHDIEVQEYEKTKKTDNQSNSINMRDADALIKQMLENMDSRYKFAMHSLVLNCIEKVRFR